jgi:membrane associated rhomboid family serine protease
MNMMSTYAIGTLLERRIGTLRMICTVVLSTGTTAVLSIGAAIVLRTLFRYDTWMNQHSIGFSGVLFHWSVLECNIGPHGNRNLFGIVEVPSFIYPWVLYVHMRNFSDIAAFVLLVPKPRHALFTYQLLSHSLFCLHVLFRTD